MKATYDHIVPANDDFSVIQFTSILSNVVQILTKRNLYGFPI